MTATFKTLVNFTGANGQSPYGALILDAAGNLYGTTDSGGAYGEGAVFEIANGSGGYGATTTLVSFTINTGNNPDGALYRDSAGNLFCTTDSGGTYSTNPNGAISDGAIDEITFNGTYATTPTTLASFNGSDGAHPDYGLLSDAFGNLFGTTYTGGANNDGAVFELKHLRATGGYSGVPTLIASFNGTDGQEPLCDLISDASGNLFGTAYGGGAHGNGTIFEIASGANGYASTPVDLADLNGTRPQGALVADAAGDLFGTTTFASGVGYGTIFELVKTNGSFATSVTLLATFDNADGSSPNGGLIMDAVGDLFGTTAAGGPNGLGTVFELAKTSGHYAATPTVVASFNSSNGATPFGALVADKLGNLFGTTSNGYANGDGGVFEISNSGFVACYARGARLLTARGQVAVEDLRVGEPVMTALRGLRPVVWIGHREVNCARHPEPRRVWAVRIAAGAFGPGLPLAPLALSPDHAVYADGVLIPAKLLVNGATITQPPCDSVTYYHVELDRHDVLLAEGIPAESYLDAGNRGCFANGGAFMTLHPDFAPGNVADACAQYVAEGEAVTRLRRLLLVRAQALGFTLVDAPDLHLRVDGRRIEGVADGSCHRFALPAGAREILLCSRAAMPVGVDAAATDWRRIGVALGALRLDGRAVALDDARLGAGWHPCERADAGPWRWTDGEAILSAAAFGCPLALEVEIVASQRVWVEPARGVAAAA